MPDEFILTFADGAVMGLYDDAALPILRELGILEIRRISDVEPDGDWWSARIRHGFNIPPVKLGPFPTRAEALSAEIAFLVERL